MCDQRLLDQQVCDQQLHEKHERLLLKPDGHATAGCPPADHATAAICRALGDNVEMQSGDYCTPVGHTPAAHAPAGYSTADHATASHASAFNCVQGAEDKVERALLSLAADRKRLQTGSEEEQAQQSAEWDVLAAPEWPGVPAKATLLSPSRCRALWRQFTSDTNFAVQQVLCCCTRSLCMKVDTSSPKLMLNTRLAD